jgi:hypothetical protein
MIVQFAACRVEIDEQHRLVRTIFGDGAELVAAPRPRLREHRARPRTRLRRLRR